jgi:CheY-like chemotaxis protein
MSLLPTPAPAQVEQFSRHAARLAAVLLDLQLPGSLDGWDAALAMRALEAAAGPGPAEPAPSSCGGALAGGGLRGAGVPIVACTACAPDGAVPPDAGGGGGAGLTVRQHAMACGADAVVHKPVPTRALRALVGALLARRRGGGGGGGDGLWGAAGADAAQLGDGSAAAAAAATAAAAQAPATLLGATA